MIKHFQKIAENIAERDIIFLYPKKNKRLLKELVREGDSVNKNYQRLVKIVKTKKYVCPEAEWIFDHFYLIQYRWADLKADFDKKNFLSLPQVGSGPFKGYPRIYNLIVQLLSFSDNKVNFKQLVSFLNGYQEHDPLLISELTALPQIISLQIILNFNKKIEETIEKIEQVNKADEMFKKNSFEDKEGVRQYLALLRKETNLNELYYIERLWQKLEGDKNYHRTIKRWLDSYLRNNQKNFSSIFQTIKKKNRQSEEFFANTIETLKWVSNVNWSKLVEEVSVVEKILCQDPAQAYYRMDKKGKSLYQEKIQITAKKFKVKEVDIAKNIVSLALKNINNHVGYFLIKEGYEDLEKAFRYKKGFKDKIKKFIVKNKIFFYFGSIFVFTFLFSFLIISLLTSSNYLLLFVSAIIVILLSLEVTLILINYLLSKSISPKVPVRLFYKEIPRESKTLVVIHSLFNSRKDIDLLINNLKINYFNSSDNNIFYSLLFDFKDSSQLEEKQDKEFLDYANLKIDELNNKFGQKFFLFCRKRSWNPVEKVFMGWERKRGKLMELNQLLLENKNTSFLQTCPDVLRDVKYVITLDEDSIMPKESAKLLIGTLAHPLNKPVFDKKKKRVISGYTFAQPHIGIRLSETQSSLFAKIFSLPSVIDPYTHALSDIYQDVFGSGCYVGKGIYELESFSKVLKEKIPDNTVLSHDLLEGAYARTGLVSDVLFFESFPLQFNTYLHRLHRWVRGDWQIFTWLFPKVKNYRGEKEKNTLAFLEKWKIFDNLRRSILSFVFVSGILLGIIFEIWPLFSIVVLAFILPFLLSLFSYFSKSHKNISLLNRFFRLKQIVIAEIGRIIFRFIFLLAHCYIELSAIFQVFIRRFILKRKFLEWQTYNTLLNRLKGNFLESVEIMIVPLFFAFALLIYAFSYQNIFLILVAFIWILSPLVSFLISRPINFNSDLKEKEVKLLKKWALRSWSYYQTFVTEETNFLPPDNVREGGKIYYYTSPTNIGTYFISLVSARTLAYLSPSEFIYKVSCCLETVEKMEKKRGHLYNWYNIKTLKPSDHKYLSSVDSGNFIASLFVLKQALKEVKNKNFSAPEEIQEAIKSYLFVIKETISSFKQNKEIQDFSKEISKYLNQEGSIKLSVLNVFLTNFLNNISSAHNEELFFWLKATKERIDLFTDESSYLIDQGLIEKNLNKIEKIIDETDFKFLYDKEQKLFKIGYNVAAHKWDAASYDLLGSEASITSFLGIALNQIEPVHWGKLNRTLIRANRKPVLLSWGGSLFEHINNFIFFKFIPKSLLSENGKEVIRSHLKYGRKLKIPWGMSEAAYFSSENNNGIAYRVFGVPKIGVKRDLAQYKVISPYSSFLALSLKPKKAIANLLKIKKYSFGKFGFYDSIDFKKNIPRSIPAYYAHHVGFSLASICNRLKENKIQDLFFKNSCLLATQYLLEELYLIDAKISKLPKKELYSDLVSAEAIGPPIKEFIPVQSQIPQSMFLSNGKISSMISNNGTNSLFIKEIKITPFSRLENKKQGWQIFLKDKDSDLEWPILSPEEIKEAKYRVAFHENLAEFNTNYNDIETQTDITISSQENIEVRRVTVINHSNKSKNIELKTQGEVVLADQRKELLSPYFHRFFLRLGLIFKQKVWLIKRSYLFPDDQEMALVHWISSPHKRINIKAQGEKQKSWFSLRPQFSNVANFKLKAKEKITLYCFTGIVFPNQKLKTIIKKYNKKKHCHNIFKNFNNQEAQYLQSLNINYVKAKDYRKLGSKIFWQETDIRFPGKLAQTQRRDFLWRFGISGNLPLVVFSVKDIEDLSAVRDFINTFAYLKFKGLKFDLVVLDEEEKSYIEPIREQLETIIQKEKDVHFIFKNDLSKEECISLKSLAIAYFPIEEECLTPKKEQIDYNAHACCCEKEKRENVQDLSFFNHYGGFLNKGKEYLILSNKDNYPDSPWSNFLVNENFGCLTSHYGLGPTWYLNSQQNRLTPWNFSPIKSHVSEFFYLKENNCVWSLTLAPLPNNNDYKTIHGKAYTEYQNKNHGIETKLKTFVQENCKFYQITLENKTNKEKELSLHTYFPLVLGDFSETQFPLEISKTNNLFLAKQIIENSVGKTKVGVWSRDKVSSHSFYQPDVFSRNSNFNIPSLIKEEGEQKITSYPCISFSNKITIAAQTKKECLILMVAHSDEKKIKETIEKFQEQENNLPLIQNQWEQILSKITIKTPSPSLDILFNHWLLYQNISSRLLAKTGTYQQGGAFGFRDQIQDLLSLTYIQPEKVREMLIYFSSKQFEEGDVLNWWQEPEGLGSRSLISDIHLWLPFVLAYYIEKTGDESILEERASYLKGVSLEFNEKDAWVGVPEKSSQEDSLYHHALKALEKSFQFGENKLPLMGTADWNDGLTLIGKKGKGESVWLAFFLYYNLCQYVNIAKKRKDDFSFKKLSKVKNNLKKAILNSSWDGKWFVRAFHDMGFPIGTNKNEECKIDLITQAWSIISGIADKDKEKHVIHSVLDLLYDEKNKLITLFTPPVSSETKIPYGYVQGYPENVRENGGQYNHAAIWFLEAATKAKRSDIVEEIIETINPVTRSNTKEKAERYKVEPYVLAADIGKEKDQAGQGGWTWYTASGGLFYKTILENVLGLKIVKGKVLSLDPCIPPKWKEYEIVYRYGETDYIIKVINKSLTGFGVKSAILEGKKISAENIPLIDDNKKKEITIVL
jgi:cyclic beta-1,2-glucan synthetase